MKRIFPLLIFTVSVLIFSCKERKQRKVPAIGFLDLLQDETLEQARKGFFVALNDEGYNPMHKTVEVIYRNAQNDQLTLLQAATILSAST